MSFLNALIRREPVMTMAVIQSGLGLGLAFGVSMTPAQLGAIMTFSAAVLGWIVRANVTPFPPIPPPT